MSSFLCLGDKNKRKIGGHILFSRIFFFMIPQQPKIGSNIIFLYFLFYMILGNQNEGWFLDQ